MNGSSAKSKLLITFPSQLWLSLTKKYTNLQFEIKAFIPVEQDPFVGNSLIAITGSVPDSFLQELDYHPSLISYSVMERTPNQMIINTVTKDHVLLLAIVKNMILVDLPVPVSNGVAEFVISSTRSNIDQFIHDLESRELLVEIKSIGVYSEDLLQNVLTPRQFEVYNLAKQNGYYESPRQITLTELAREIDVAKSSLSSILQRIHSKLLGSS
ncbi:MAG: helix-turn-helix domain-containing protein [Promethearchaeota archaeon]